ncbi:PQQ-binding-like beta-propeller repeat protein [Cellulomonas endophytica]|uniref:outer membrane protein assembly factor BamB family protein n=1 Tax=Cellulomonas endophytica TaxID=2494735 RepID=UPI0010101245|nr:PQQ-binding-like beta-propeller repeat protein [Cellulomonas endophytica]
MPDHHRFAEVVWDDAEARPDDGGPAQERRRLPRPPRWLALCTVGVLVAGAGAVLAVDLVRDARLDAELADVEGLSVRLDDPVQPGWEIDDARYMITATDAVVVVQHEEQVTAVDTRTGRTVWTRPGNCDIFQTVADRSFAGRRTGHHRLVCREPAPGTGADRYTSVATDTGAGAVPVDLPAAEWWFGLEDRVVTYGRDDDDVLQVVVADVSGAHPAWTWRDSGPTDEYAPFAAWSPDGTTLVVEVLGRQTTLDLTTGAVLPVEPAGGGLPARDLPDGSTLRAARAGDGSLHTGAVGPDGQERWNQPGYPLTTRPDDGTTFDVVLLGQDPDGGVTAVDATNGRELWTLPELPRVVAALRGVLVVPGPQRTTVLDARGGTPVWEQVSVSVFGDVISDGRAVLQMETRGLSNVLAARDLHTGEVRWEVPAGNATGDLFVLPDGSVLLNGGGTTVRRFAPAG